jgi:hypothetical protein
MGGTLPRAAAEAAANVGEICFKKTMIKKVMQLTPQHEVNETERAWRCP